MTTDKEFIIKGGTLKIDGTVIIESGTLIVKDDDDNGGGDDNIRVTNTAELMAAVNNLKDNTTILLKRGSVFSPSKRIILKDKTNIVFDAYGDGNPPIVDGSNTPKHAKGYSQPSYGGLIEFQQCKNCVVQHLEVANSQNTGIYIYEGADNQVLWNTIHDCRAWSVLAYTAPGKKCYRPVMMHNDCYNLCTAITELPNGQAFGKAGGEAAHFGRCVQYLCAHNRFHNYYKEGVSIGQENEGGKCYNNYIFGANKEVYRRYSAGVCIYINPHRGNVQDLLVYNNVTKEDYTGIAFGSEEGGNTENIKVWNNILIDGRDGSLAFIGSYRGPDKHGVLKNAKCWNNTIIHTLRNRNVVNIIQKDKMPGLDISGNLIVRDPASSTNMIRNVGRVDGVHHNQFWNGGQSIRGVEDNPTLADPEFVKYTGDWPQSMVCGAYRKTFPVLTEEYLSTASVSIPTNPETKQDITNAERDTMSHFGAFN